MSTLRLLVLALILSGCAEMEQLKSRLMDDQTPPTARIYVANESSSSVSVIDATSFKQIALIDPKNVSTHDLALSRDGTRLYATNLASGRLSVIDTRGLETIASIYTGKRCHVVALTNDNRQAWVANIGPLSPLTIGVNEMLGQLTETFTFTCTASRLARPPLAWTS